MTWCDGLISHFSLLVFAQSVFLSLVNPECIMHSAGKQTNGGLNFRWARFKLGLIIETSVSFAQQIQQDFLLHFNQLPTNPGAQGTSNQPRPRSQTKYIAPQATSHTTNGHIYLQVQGKCGKSFIVNFDLLVPSLCVVKWPSATGGGGGGKEL